MDSWAGQSHFHTTKTQNRHRPARHPLWGLNGSAALLHYCTSVILLVVLVYT